MECRVVSPMERRVVAAGPSVGSDRIGWHAVGRHGLVLLWIGAMSIGLPSAQGQQPAKPIPKPAAPAPAVPAPKAKVLKPGIAIGQLVPGQNDENGNGIENVFFPVDRRTMQKLKASQDEIAKEAF